MTDPHLMSSTRPLGRALALLLVLLFALSAGCGSTGGDDRPLARVALRLLAPESAQRTIAAVPATVHRVRVTVEGPGMEPIEVVVEVAGQTSVTVLLDVPVGPGRTFTVVALAETGETVFAGSTTADVRGEDLAVSISMEVVIEGTVASPVFSLPEGTYIEPVEVAISSETPEALLYYTEDGSTPSADTGILYAGPFTLATSTTLRAVAVRLGWADSAEAQATYTITGTVGAPVFTPSGGTFTGPVEVTIASDTAGAAVYYTTDGSTPSAASGTLYSGPITVSDTTSFQAIAVLTDWADSAESQAAYTITGTVARPVFSPPEGVYIEPLAVTIVSNTAGAAVYYTTDGSTPSAASGTLYSGPITVSEDTSFRAIAVLAGWADSPEGQADYAITGTVARPSFSPIEGVYTQSVQVTLSSDTPAASIYYTADGSAPSPEAGTLYTGPIDVAESASLRAVAVLADWANSPVTQADYTITGTVADPTFTPLGGTYTTAPSVTMNTTTQGAQIRYTTDGTTLTSASGTLYTGPVALSSTATVQAIAFLQDWADSAVASATYTLMVATPQISPGTGTYTPGQTVSISSPTSGAQLYYTTDGSTPSAASTPYAGPLSLPFSTLGTDTLRAIAVRSGWTNSAVAAATYNMQVATPQIAATPDQAVYNSSNEESAIVTISSITSGTTIHYTRTLGTVGPTPTTASPIFMGSEPLVWSTTTFKALAVRPGWANSAVATKTYEFLSQVNTPTFVTTSASASTIDVEMYSFFPGGSQISYTLDPPDGSTPSPTNGTVVPNYTTITIDVSSPVTLRAMSFQDGYLPSDVREQLYDFSILIARAAPASDLTSFPTAVSGVVLAAGGTHTVWVETDSTAWSWGDNASGQLGTADTEDRWAPAQIATLAEILGFAAGADHSVALSQQGTVLTWGRNDFGQLGVGDRISKVVPIQVAALPPIVNVVAGDEHSLALSWDGSLHVWGRNQRGQLGLGDREDRLVPAPLPGLSGVVAVAAGTDHNLALAWDGTVWAWGGNDRGQLGLGDRADRHTPQQVESLSGIVAVAAGGGHSLALDGDGTVWAWGRNDRGQLGLGDTMDRLVPEPLALTTALAAIAAGGQHSLAWSAEGALWAWGGNDRGQLGQDDDVDRWSPTPVPGIPSIAAAAAGGEHSLIMTADGLIWSWGANGSGQLGVGDTLDRFAPVALP